MKNIITGDATNVNLSSYNLFHFTDRLKFIQDIMENGFLLRFNYEKVPKARVAYICRMVCFCDIPLGNVKYHLNWYGNYGLGLNKAYCKDLAITPVCYVHSKTTHVTFSQSKNAIRKLKENPITPYLKQQRGKVILVDDKTKKDIFKWKVFYDEKEWRYIPKQSDLEVFTYKKEAELRESKINKNQNITQRLELDIDKVEYVILEGTRDIAEFVTFLDRISAKIKFDKNLMLSKILTTEQIRHDF